MVFALSWLRAGRRYGHGRRQALGGDAAAGRAQRRCGAALLLARAVGAEQEAAIGNQSGGRVFLFLETDDFERDHGRMTREGVRFMEAPRREPYGTVAVFEDLCGNRWDLIQPPPQASK